MAAPERQSAARKRKSAAKNDTTASEGSVDAFLDALSEPARAEARTLRRLFEEATGAKAKRWGKAIVGFGERKLVYESGREVDWFVAGFAPRKGRHVLYLGAGDGALDGELAALGDLERGKGCVYLRTLEGIQEKDLSRLLRKAASRAKPSR